MNQTTTFFSENCLSEEELFDYINSTEEEATHHIDLKHIESCKHCSFQLKELTNLVDSLGHICKVDFHHEKPETIGKYNIVAILDEGGMGKVWKATDPYLDRQVAIKVMKKHLMDNDKIRQRFVREAKILARLDHDNIVKVFSCGFHNDEMYIVMEYIEGKPIYQPGTTSDFNLNAFIDHSIQISTAIDTAHCGGVIHRDLKPNNIMMDSIGRIKLLDFGIARQMDLDHTLTETGELTGTIKYMAPEVINNGEPNIISDIYSFGIILYEWVSAKNLFDSHHLPTLIDTIRESSIPDLSNQNCDIPPALSKLIMQMCHKNPKDRPQSLDDIIARLLAIKDPRSIGSASFKPTKQLSQSSVYPQISSEKLHKLCVKKNIPENEIDKVFELLNELQNTPCDKKPQSKLTRASINKAIRTHKRNRGYKINISDYSNPQIILQCLILCFLIYLVCNNN